MNLIVIGDDVDHIALDIWKGNTNYVVLNQSPCLWNKDFLKYIKNKNVIVSSTAEQFVEKTINEVIEYLVEHDFIPVLIAKDKKSIENNIYTGLSSEIPNTILYTKNKENKDYNELLKITHGYLLGKGLINENKTLRTPRKRKTTITKK
jgi:hypothetical protein